MSPEHATGNRWLSIVGIGEDGVAGLGDNAKQAIASAAFVFGGKRHLALAEALISGEARPWSVPFDPTMADVVALRGKPVCALASGDPFFFGVGVNLSRVVSRDEYVTYPAPSSFSLAASRLGWALQDIEAVSLHGRPTSLIRPLLHPARRILALTSDGRGPAELARLLAGTGFSTSHLTVLEALGGENERIRSAQAFQFALSDVSDLNVVAIEVKADAEAQPLPLASGLEDDFFEHDGQMTKREIRALTLSALAPRRGGLLWDIGAGSGSIGIEWMLRHPSMRTIAIEADPVRADRARKNANSLGVPGLQLVEGTAPTALADLEAPDAIFIGGGGSDDGVLETAMDRLKPRGRLVANAVTLETEKVLLEARAQFGGRLVRLQLSRAEPVGSMQGWRPAMPVTQWTWHKDRMVR
ncbi:precorrin-6Y C5,15-methyltransferase (decarboxylating) [Pseudorhizobium tarimense]|uniref:Precorrin-6Y C5,15-methyltransferase (Decarboxylating) n=2 Tax=Pseudorhizobium tarimense TaxID=1079109 RepID=A0ABV2H4V4_9HYPH|nr:precorrin-6y C5,15-methyltransferase (decarboxylating) subunit CbiE [Pseudorhizobium tarimense]MCJ8518767.1 precorrin-6y C5,15-methyltransferase (decarboxylating) subunit CbiE [Pseudorhizobium tarimense]